MKGRDLVMRVAAIAVLGGLSAAGFLLQKPGTEGEVGGTGIAQGTSAAWFCPGLLPHAGRTETVAVSNPGAESLTGRLTIYGDGKTIQTRSIDVPALGSLAVDIGREITPNRVPVEITNSQSAGYVAVVELDGQQAVVGSGTYVARGSITDVATTRCPSSLSRRLTLAGGTSVRGTSTDMFLANPLGHDAVSNVSILTEEGVDEPPKLQRLPALASNQASYRVSDESRRRWVLDVEVTATVGEIAGLIEMASDGTRIGSGVARIPQVLEASSTWMFPVYSESNGSDAILSVANPLPESRRVEVRTIPDGSVSPTAEGALRPGIFDVPPSSAITITPSPGLGEGARFGLSVEASDGKPIYASATLRPRPPSRGVGVSSGEARGFSRWVLQDPSDLGLPPGARVVVTLMNVGDKEASVKVSAFGSGTTSRLAGLDGVTVGRGRAATVDVSSLQLPSGVRSLVFDSDTPVVAEATVATGGDPATGFDIVKLTPLQPVLPTGAPVSTAGIGIPGGSTTVVFAVALISAALVVTLLGRRRRLLDGPRGPAAGVGLDERVLLEIVSSGTRSRSDGRVDGDSHVAFVLFSHEGCRACAAARELLEAVVERCGGDVVEVGFDADEERFEAAGVGDVPTTALVIGGRVEAVWVGPLEGAELEAALERSGATGRGSSNRIGPRPPEPTRSERS